MVPSANLWLDGKAARRQSYYETAISSAVRSPDPYQKISGSWLIRRLSPDSDPIRTEDLPEQRDEETLLTAMGTETANVHLGNRRAAKKILADLRRRKPEWLQTAAKKMAKTVLEEWEEYRKQSR